MNTFTFCLIKRAIGDVVLFVGASNSPYLHPLQEWLLRFPHQELHLRNDLLKFLVHFHKTYRTIYITNCDSDMINCFSFYFTTLFFSLLLVTKAIETSSITFYLTYFLIRSSCWLNLVFHF